jgi:hypothetical protein
MSFFHSTATACILILATPAIASAEWYHSSARGVQFEGGYSGEGFFVSYGCGLSDSLRFVAKGAFVTGGDGFVSLDGKQIYAGATTYDSSHNQTEIGISVECSYGKETLTQFNNILKSIASGNKLIRTYPDGTTFTAPLKNSARITSCEF